MFTGIIEAVGLVGSCRPAARGKSFILEIRAPKFSRSLKVGGSLSVNGVCLTVIKKKRQHVFFNVIKETLERSTLPSLKAGDAVNLERPLKLNARIGGHFVLGHVDAVGRIRRIVARGNEKSFLVSFPKPLKPYILEKGSIAVDGVSLTVGKAGEGSFWVHGIPHTLKSTNFKNFREKTRVNLEADLLAKLAVQRKPKVH